MSEILPPGAGEHVWDWTDGRYRVGAKLFARVVVACPACGRPAVVTDRHGPAPTPAARFIRFVHVELVYPRTAPSGGRETTLGSAPIDACVVHAYEAAR
jgi:hypothetical protein